MNTRPSMTGRDNRALLSIAPLTGLDDGSERLFGGKARGLARLIAAGARVPDGFAVEATSEEWSQETVAAFDARVRGLLRAGSVAVRSSAIGEDSSTRSFAGQFDSFLNLSSPEEAAEAAARCLGSGRSERVMTYAGVSSPIAVGVVVQRMVAARSAGVCFTQAASGAESAVLIEAVRGLGDKLVSGATEPERWRADPSDGGRTECIAKRRESAVSRDEISRIAEEAARLAVAFDQPLDLEWAIDQSGVIWWLQARPVTAPVFQPAHAIERSYEDARDGPVTVWSNWNVRETMPDPLYPLTWTIWRDCLLPVITSQVTGVPQSSPLIRQLYALDRVNGRIYFNMNAVLAAPVLGAMTRHFLKIMDSRTGETMDRLMAAGVLRPRRVEGARWLLIPRMMKAALLGLMKMMLVVRPRRALASLASHGTKIDRREDVRHLSNEALLAEMDLWARPECSGLLSGLQMEAAAAIVYVIAEKLFRAHPEARQRLATGISANPTTQISIGVDALAEAARPLATVFRESLSTQDLLRKLETAQGGPEWLAQLDDFLALFGHRGPMEFDIGAVRWAEDPTMIIDLVRMSLQTSEVERVASRIERLAGDRRRYIREAVEASALWRRPLMSVFSRLVELYMPLREAPKHYGVFVFRRIRQAALELGRRLHETGILQRPDDVFFLELHELAALARGQRLSPPLSVLIDARREKLEGFRREPAPDIVRSDGAPVVESDNASDRADGVLRGTPVSAGTACGPVRVLTQPDPRAMSDGDVIVLKFADPGWTPLFPRAAAVVMEVGGLMCHAAVVAREIGIPAVFGVTGATRLLVDGEIVTVDGASGTVRRGSGARFRDSIGATAAEAAQPPPGSCDRA